MKYPFIAAALFLAGCAHVGKQATRAPSPNAAAADQVIPVGSTATLTGSASPAYPAEYEEYYVGMIPDDDDPNFAYRPGDLIVRTRPARFRFDGQDGIAPTFDEGPETFARMANDHPEPTETELTAMVARSQRVVSALTEENQSLLAQVRAKPADPAPMPAQTPAGHPADPPAAQKGSGALAAVADESPLNVIAPNDDYVIELDSNLFVAPAPATTNPFVQLYQPPVAWRELAIQVSAAVPGPKPTAIIDGEPYSVGDNYKDLTVYRVEADTVYLRKDSFLLACPVSERTLKLRLP
jgi:hypothetical protein